MGGVKGKKGECAMSFARVGLKSRGTVHVRDLLLLLILVLCRTSGRGYRSATGAQAWASAQLASAAKSAPLGLFSKCATVEMGGGGESAPYYPNGNKRGFTGQQTH